MRYIQPKRRPIPIDQILVYPTLLRSEVGKLGKVYRCMNDLRPSIREELLRRLREATSAPQRVDLWARLLEILENGIDFYLRLVIIESLCWESAHFSSMVPGFMSEQAGLSLTTRRMLVESLEMTNASWVPDFLLALVQTADQRVARSALQGLKPWRGAHVMSALTMVRRGSDDDVLLAAINRRVEGMRDGEVDDKVEP